MKQKIIQEGDGLFVREAGVLQPSARKLLEQVVDEEIKTLEIVRTPLSSFTKGFLNAISLGQFEKISKKYYDEMFHLSIWINDKYNLEKNEVIAFNQKNPIEQKSEVKQVQVIPAGLTFQTLIDKTVSRMGDKFGPYNAETNNCQDFITNVFKANNIGDESDFKFIKQDTKEIFSKLPEFSKTLGNLTTKAGAIFNRLIYGEGEMNGYGACGEPMGECMCKDNRMYGSGSFTYYGQDDYGRQVDIEVKPYLRGLQLYDEDVYLKWE